MMDTFVAPQRTEKDRIEAYLNKAFAPFKFDAVKSAARFQSQLGIPVSPEDVDLIYTCEALSSEIWTNAGKQPQGSSYRYHTQCFRDVVEEMRLDTQHELTEAVYKLEAGGASHEQAVLQMLRTAVDPLTLRKEAMQVGYNTCMERSGALIRRKDWLQARIVVIVAWIVAYALLSVWVILTKTPLSHSIGLFVSNVLCFPGIVGISYSCPVRRIDAALQAEVDEFVARRHMPNVSIMQRVLWTIYKLRYPASSRPLDWWLKSLAVVVVTSAVFSVPAFRYIGGFLAVFGIWYAYVVGHRIWDATDKVAKLNAHKAAS